MIWGFAAALWVGLVGVELVLRVELACLDEVLRIIHDKIRAMTQAFHEYESGRIDEAEVKRIFAENA